MQSTKFTMLAGRVAGAAGLEPVTSAVTGQRSNQLSYAPAIGESGRYETSSPKSTGNWGASRVIALVHLGNAPVGSARSCRVRGRGSVVECGSPLPLCDLRKKDRPYAPRAEAKAPAAVAALWRAGEGWRTPKASPRRCASAGAVCGCALVQDMDRI